MSKLWFSSKATQSFFFPPPGSRRKMILQHFLKFVKLQAVTQWNLRLLAAEAKHSNVSKVFVLFFSFLEWIIFTAATGVEVCVCVCEEVCVCVRGGRVCVCENSAFLDRMQMTRAARCYRLHTTAVALSWIKPSSSIMHTYFIILKSSAHQKTDLPRKPFGKTFSRSQTKLIFNSLILLYTENLLVPLCTLHTSAQESF